MSQQQQIVSFELVGGVGHTTDYKNVVDARIKDPEGLRRMCNTMVNTPECASNERAVYALAGLRLLDDPNFGPALDSVAKRPGTFLYAGAGVKAPETHDMAYVRFIFERFYKSCDDLTMPPGVERPKRIDYSSPSRTRKPVLVHNNNHVPDVVQNSPQQHNNHNARAPDPPHRNPTCVKCSRNLVMQLVHVNAFCDVCAVPLPPTRPAWTCERCDQDMCHACAIKRFAAHVLAGGAGIIIPQQPAPVSTWRPRIPAPEALAEDEDMSQERLGVAIESRAMR